MGHFCPPGSGSGSTDPIESGSATLVEGANILHLLAASTASGVEGVLWPHLLEFLLQPEYTAAVAAISKALTVVAGRRVAANGEGLAVAYQNLQVSSVADSWVWIRIRESIPLTKWILIRIRMQILILLSSSATVKTSTKNNFFCLLLFEGTFKSFFKYKRS